ncbi:MAG: bifunctional riboflavin kinase/FAD synthetase [Gemmatirosa sp.]
MAEQLTPTPDDESWLPPDVGGTVVTVGTFDGVHRGHQDVLARLSARARAVGLRSLLVTFDPHPLEVVNPDAAPPLLTPGREKLAALAESGVDYVAVVPFTRVLASYEAAQFVDLVLRDRLRMRELFIGHDHGFGRGRAGDAHVLQRLGAERGFHVEVVEPIAAEGHAVSSTAIRRAVAGGDLHRAEAGLGRPYGVTGTVAHGERRGRLLGYPTLNIALPSPRKLLPPEGVYAVRVHTRSGSHGGMLNLGPRPTFGDTARSLEAHLFDVEGDWYGQTVGVDFVARLRDTRRFDGVEALVAQLGRDAHQARRALSQSSVATR